MGADSQDATCVRRLEETIAREAARVAPGRVLSRVLPPRSANEGLQGFQTIRSSGWQPPVRASGEGKNQHWCAHAGGRAVEREGVLGGDDQGAGGAAPHWVAQEDHNESAMRSGLLERGVSHFNGGTQNVAVDTQRLLPRHENEHVRRI